jgi:hypothetical protein
MDTSKLHLPDGVRNNAPPTTFGLKRHGSLTAAQWYNTCCFNLLITLTRLWGNHIFPDVESQWLQNYWHLCSLIRIAHLRSLEQSDIERFRFHCRQYVVSFARLFPTAMIRPSHHYLLHMADQMEWFGPLPGRWAFPSSGKLKTWIRLRLDLD